MQKVPVDKKEGLEKDYMQMLQDSVWASTRLAAVLALQKQGNLKKDAAQALEKIAVSDESSNVRMAAIETLLDGMTPEVRQQKVQDFLSHRMILHYRLS
ncbi:HEAT repeat domain-containing protein [Sphingobacterium sp. E70]|uniref:HEAT repeat domain-containing protein n=1 Tax=Sphingobacterium sp. E70 TaxID=2853439 RepID=UPI00211C0036|nr:HEAT repeat domain-containing protein [Sphingobacterium sp. E70]ULT26617.1 HEAT repeat domain-containing protein [Sphingobacterium sp. E70]